jgi:Amt family ammonium transporter
MGGMACYLAVSKLKAAWGYDDSLDVFGVHGIGSVIGMLCLGWFASPSINGPIDCTFKTNGQVVSLAGGTSQFLNQAEGVLFTVALAAAATFLILKLVKAVVGLRVNEEEESLGLDLYQHGESAYND